MIGKLIVLAIWVSVIVTHIIGWSNVYYMLLSLFLMIPMMLSLPALFDWIDKYEQTKNPGVIV